MEKITIEYFQIYYFMGCDKWPQGSLFLVGYHDWKIVGLWPWVIEQCLQSFNLPPQDSVVTYGDQSKLIILS